MSKLCNSCAAWQRNRSIPCPLWGESTNHLCIPHTTGQLYGALMFSLFQIWTVEQAAQLPVIRGTMILIWHHSNGWFRLMYLGQEVCGLDTMDNQIIAGYQQAVFKLIPLDRDNVSTLLIFHYATSTNSSSMSLVSLDGQPFAWG